MHIHNSKRLTLHSNSTFCFLLIIPVTTLDVKTNGNGSGCDCDGLMKLMGNILSFSLFLFLPVLIKQSIHSVFSKHYNIIFGVYGCM